MNAIGKNQREKGMAEGRQYTDYQLGELGSELYLCESERRRAACVSRRRRRCSPPGLTRIWSATSAANGTSRGCPR